MAIFRRETSSEAVVAVSTESGAGALKSILAAGSVFEGSLRGELDVVVEGHFVGDVRIDADLQVAVGGEVRGEVEAKTVVVAGTLRGAVKQAQLVRIDVTGSVEGDIVSRRLVIEEGGRLEGNSYTSSPGLGGTEVEW